MKWHQLDSPAVLRVLNSDPVSGLSEPEATRRLGEYGRNELVGTGVKSARLILWEQLSALMVVILIAAAILSVLLGDYKDAIAIGAIVALNAILGFSQEYRAEKAMAALKKMAVPSVRVRRDGEVKEIPAFRLVPQTLGSVTVICSDKIGTLTQNQRTVVVLQLRNESLALAPHSRIGEKIVRTGEQSGFGLLLGRWSALQRCSPPTGSRWGEPICVVG